MMSSLVGAIRDVREGRELLNNLTLRELRSKYKRTALGWAWSMLNPLATIAIYSVIFGTILHGVAPEGNPSGINNFTLYLSCALLTWNFTSSGVQATIPTLVGNANLIKKVYFPRELLIGASVISWMVSFLIELGVLVAVISFTGHMVLQWIPVVLVLVFIQFFLVLGFSLALSALNVYYRDISYLSGIVFQAWMFLTPIVYPIESIDKAGNKHVFIPIKADIWFWHDFPVRFVYKLNPMVHYVTAYRNLLYDGRFPGTSSLIYIGVMTPIVMIFGWSIFRRMIDRVAEEV